MNYVLIPAGSSDEPLGTTGRNSPGDLLEQLTCVVATAATSTVTIKDGAGSSITILPANVGSGVGVYPVKLHMTAKAGKWTVTTGAGVSVIAVGVFL